MASVQQGMQLVNNTDFEGFLKQRMQALKNFNINDIVVDGHRAVSAICNNTHRFCDNHIQTIYYS